MTFVGFDLYERYITACALDAGGAVLGEIRQLAPTLETILARHSAVPQPVVIAMEATLYWEWLVARLQEAGHTAHVADAYQVKLICQARSRTDTVDVRKLAADAGLVPRTRGSGGKTTHGALAKMSNHWLEWILVENVQTLKLVPGPVGACYRHLLRAKGKPKATTAAARKLSCFGYWMLKEDWTYSEWLEQHQQVQRPEGRPTQRLGAMA